MGTMQVSLVVTGILLLLICLSGIWLKRAGRPLNAGISAIHKLIGVGAGVFLIMTLVRMNDATPLTTGQWVAVVAAAACFVGTVATGGLLSTDKPATPLLTALHRIIPALTVVATAGLMYVLFW